MELKLYEEKQEQVTGIANWKDLMTDEEYRRGQYYNTLYLIRQAEMQINKPDWDRIEELCACQRDADANDPDYPNNFVPLITPVIEGQVASIIEGDIEFSHVTDNPAHTQHMIRYDAASTYARRMNHFLDYFKDFTREYDKLGNAIITVSWEKRFSTVKGKPSGYPRLTVCPLLSVIIDGRIKDSKDLQYADYIIHEIGFQTRGWAKDTYGIAKGNALCAGYNRYEGENPDQSIDDSKTFTLLHVWTRNNEQGNLQLIEMDSNGFVFRISDPSKPYYDFVNNEYPFYFSRMIPIVGQLYGYGDGAILKYPQEYINNLADELELACRFSAQPKVIVDERAAMGLDQLTSNPADIAVCHDPKNNIMILQAMGINPVILQTIQFIRDFAPEAVRFSPLMTGNQRGVSATATQINSQMMQGQVGITDKKSDISRAMEWVDRYSLKLCMQYWDKPFWSSLGNNYQQFVDMKDMMKAPSAVPIGAATTEKISKFRPFNKLFNKSKIKTDLAKTDEGEIIYTDIDFDTKVFIGKGIAKDSTSMFNILNSLAGTILIMPDQTRRMAITPKCYIESMEQLLGRKLRSEGEEEENLEGAAFDQNALTGQNPIGNNGVIQKPQEVPENLMSTMPQVAGGDNRGVTI